jgi:hypothetical protein
MEYKLTIPERIHVLNLLPSEGSFVTLQALREITSKVGFKAEEISAYDIKEVDGVITWNDLGSCETSINLVDAEAEIIRKELRKKNAEEKLNMGIFSVYEKFME